MICFAVGLTVFVAMFSAGVIVGGLWVATRRMNQALDELWLDWES